MSFIFGPNLLHIASSATSKVPMYRALIENQVIVAYEKMGLPLVHNPALNMMF